MWMLCPSAISMWSQPADWAPLILQRKFLRNSIWPHQKSEHSGIRLLKVANTRTKSETWLRPHTRPFGNVKFQTPNIKSWVCSLLNRLYNIYNGYSRCPLNKKRTAEFRTRNIECRSGFTSAVQNSLFGVRYSGLKPDWPNAFMRLNYLHTQLSKKPYFLYRAPGRNRKLKCKTKWIPAMGLLTKLAGTTKRSESGG